MSRRILSLTLTGFLVIVFLDWSCTKLDTTNIGSDLLPEVDNIKTFADTFSITTTQGAFDGSVFKDSTKLSVSNTAENYPLGKIINDPLFGKTDAELYLQLKPGFYPYYYGVAGDTLLELDSVVLCLAYKGIWGDTTQLATQPIKLQVFEVSQSAHGVWDSLGTYNYPSLRPVWYKPDIEPIALSGEIPINLDSVRAYKKIGKGNDSVINQIRLRITDPDFLAGIADPDTTIGGIFERDTMFRAFNNGFGIKMTTASNVLLYTQLNDAMTRLEIHYKRKNGSLLKDTSMSKFVYNNGIGGTAAPRRGAVAGYIQHDRSSTPLPTGDQEIYLQSSPGTYATLKIPQLTGYSNRIIHRAEIIMEQIPGDPITDALYSVPNYLYLDLVDTGVVNRWKPIYYDLNPSLPYDPDNFAWPTSGYYYYPSTFEVDFNYFGGVPKTKTDAMGTRKSYTINISRYVQKIVTHQSHNYEMRLFAPHSFIYPQYTVVESPQVERTIPYVNNVGIGRVRLGGGNNSNPNYRMRLRIIYSKID